MTKSVIIIGAGIGGLTAAISLAQAGFSVTVLEKNAQVGGKIQTFTAGGFHWETGPVALTARHLLEQLFQDAGRRLQDHLRLQPLDPIARCFFPDGDVFDIHRDWSDLAAEVTRLNADDLEGFMRFMAQAATMNRGVGWAEFQGAFSHFGGGSAAQPSRRVRAQARRNMWREIKNYVKSPKLQQVLGHFAVYAGGSPYAVPAAYNAIAHQVLSGGAFYPRGGLSSVAVALEKLALDLGVTIRKSCPVEQIRISNDAATGVSLPAGDLLPADAVISNVDAVSTARFLMPEAALPPVRMNQLRRQPLSASAFVMLLGVRGSHPQLAHHNVFFPPDPALEFEQLFSLRILPDDPTISLIISSKSDPHHAPAQQENWRLQVSAPALSERFIWSAQQAAYRDRILTTLNRRFGLDLAGKLRIKQHLTPADFQRISGAWRGALYGASPNNSAAAFAQAKLQSEHFKRLYFVGGTVRPGGGLTQALMSGRAVVDVMRRDQD